VFTSAFDLPYGVVVWLFSGTTNGDDDFERYIEEIKTLDSRSAGRENPAAILVVDKGNPVPDARWRRRIAEESAVLVSRKPLFAVVSDSRVVRGVVTAINWIRPPPYEWSVHERFEDAVRWVEGKKGLSLPVCVQLLAQARADAAARTAEAAPALGRAGEGAKR
jgi:hypothetical protein